MRSSTHRLKETSKGRRLTILHHKNNVLKISDFAVEHTKIRVQDYHIESQLIAFSGKHTKSQDQKKNNRSDRLNSH